MEMKKRTRIVLVWVGLMLVIILLASFTFGEAGSRKDRLIRHEWKKSKHSQTQKDVAKELADSHAGEAPEEVVQSENCIGCHGPTAVLANGGMTESQALGYFFSTKDGKFTLKTRAIRIARWPGVSCDACHEPNNPGQPAYFNSGTNQYETVQDSTELCGKCHGNLRFPDTDHLSYNILQGTGGVNVPDQQTIPGVTCTDCHMYTGGAHSVPKYFGHTFSVIVKQRDRTVTASCTNCHLSGMDATAASELIDQWEEEFQDADTQAQDLVSKATDALDGSTDQTLLSKLDEAQKNLTYAESDESGGFHNHNYLMVLVNDAITQAQEILNQLGIPF
jgi:formate-dependent nitrite reductase cytochrome c552 subunit